MSAEPWLILSLCSGLSTTRALELIKKFGNAAAVISASASDLKTSNLSDETLHFLKNPDAEKLNQTTSWLAAEGRHLLCLNDAGYPPLLAESGDAPLCLYVEGNPASLLMPQLAIVGSRNATPGGLETAQHFASHLAHSGLTITSGLATGIDSAAHLGALAGDGLTIAVLGTGPDEIYPQSNIKLAAHIRQQGALVSEFPPGTPPRRHQFPRRNRIISGLSLGVLIVEAGLRSGSLITARYSGNYGREIFAVPGSLHNPLSKGCHRLIKQGAKLVETGADIVSELGSLAGALESFPDYVATQIKSPTQADPDYAKLLKAMGFDPISINHLVARSGLTAEQLSSMLLILELEGKVNTLPGGRFQQV
ncbi:MAG: DNA-protecting protein DprA [Gammaproteobacteria bacterium]|nr:DNA-protecting protein DprA [Gammaproteobacteria bacterium]MCP4091752.1 DNA-protecting protein DprA [Gammaproteobacteria bacterium]MCP4275059.1 DNA-protecting protein DprA [Gammaproteobacteria bacterium]MCP4831883.1 DNA-protecting protein DprA [Gammaproteobacteria bacterium]MCP4929818.1 DNA-protecting protein DprA [Gammaproteobacteria bacterium]